MPNIDLSILNQRQTPAFYASSLATRPAFGFAGRIFIDTDSPSTGLYRDTGSAWVQIADPGAGTTGTLQQVTTNGNTTSQGITITAGGLSSNIVTIAANGLGSTANYIGQIMATNDNWKIFGTGSTADVGEMVFQVGDNGSSYASGNGERFRFSYDASSTGTARDSFIIDYDTSYFNTSVGINTPTPGTALDVHHNTNTILQLNQTVAANDTRIAFQNGGSSLWRIGNFYNAGANDFEIFDVVGAVQSMTVKKTTGQVLIGTTTVGSGKLVVSSTTGDNGVQIVGASAPSLRIDNAASGPTKRAGLGISTATNNFIQGSADRDFCMFNGSTTASPILFGVYDAGTVNVQEAARISATKNFLIGTTTDGGQKLQVNGTSKFFDSLILNRASGGNSTGIAFQTGSTNNWFIGSSAVGANTDLQFYNHSATAVVFNIANTTGNVLIGTTTDGGQKLQVNGTFYNSGNVTIGTTNSVVRLHVQDDGNTFSAHFSGNAQTNGIAFGTDSGNTPLIQGYTRTFSAITNISLQSSGGNVLIGTSTNGASKLRIVGLPTSAAGLSSGDVYSNLGILTIVP